MINKHPGCARRRLRPAWMVGALLTVLSTAAVACATDASDEPGQPPAGTVAEQRPLAGDSSAFVAENYPDGTEVPVSEEFEKTWDLMNAGSVPWIGRHLTRQGDTSGTGVCSSAPRVPIADTPPGETVTISVRVTASSTPATCHVVWKMTDADGLAYFPDHSGIWFDVIVVR